MARQTAVRKRRRAPDSIQAIAIAFGDAAKRFPAKDWRHAMGMRTRTMFRRLFVAATVILPL